VEPKDLVNRLLEDDYEDRHRYDEPAGDLTYSAIIPIGDEDVDVTVRYTATKSTPGDAGYSPGGYYIEIDSVERDDTGEEVKDKIPDDQFSDLQERVSEHFHHYVR
jgi:hypothetical protein